MSAAPPPRPPETERDLRDVLRGSARPPKAGPLSASLTFGWRTLRKVRRAPDQLSGAVIMPTMLTVLFTYLLGGAIAGSAGGYLQYLLPGIIVLAVVLATAQTGITLNLDLTTGAFDRFRVLPIWRPSVLLGAMCGDVVRYLTASVLPLGIGLALGFRPHGGPAGVLLALLFLQAFAFSLAWIWTALAMLVKTPATAQMLSAMGQFVLAFGANVFVPTRTMPGWLQAFTGVNPVTRAAPLTAYGYDRLRR
jgi:ABC-2 type transport system permease protein